MRNKYLAAALVSLTVAAGAAVSASPAAAATTCSASSYHPTGTSTWVSGLGLIECTSSIYEIHTVVELQKYSTSSGWSTVKLVTIDDFYTGGLGRAAAGNFGRGTYRTRTSGWVKSTSSSSQFPVTARLSSSFTTTS